MKFACNLHGTTPIPLADSRELCQCWTRLTPKKLRVGHRIKRLPAKGRSRQSAIASVNVETNRPEFVMVRLPHLDLSHPVKDFAGIKVAKNSAFEPEQKRRMD